MKNLDCKYSHQRQDAGIFEANKNFSWGLKGSTMCVWKMKATKAQYSIKNPMGLLANGMLIWTVPVWLHLWNFQQQSHMEVGGLMDKTLPPLWTEPHRYEGEESHCPRASWNTHVEYTGEPVIMVIKTKRVSVCVWVWLLLPGQARCVWVESGEVGGGRGWSHKLIWVWDLSRLLPLFHCGSGLILSQSRDTWHHTSCY